MRSANGNQLMTPTSRTNPFPASILECTPLNREGSKKCTLHIELDLSGSDLAYEPGDSIGIFPHNHPEVVEKTLKALRATGEEVITSREGDEVTLRSFLREKANIQRVTKKLLTAVAPNSLLLEDKAAFKELCEKRELWDFLEESPDAELDLATLPNLLLPLLPRLYSIASSRKVVGEKVHLTVATVAYETNGINRVGVCSDFLHRQPADGSVVVGTYLQPTKDFRLPDDDSLPIIMIGPGTGIAPFRAFMQERVARGATGRNWLFFGEWTREFDFFYEEEWKELSRSNLLKLTTAFSRDQEDKIYVQHKMAEHGKELISWLNEGAILYVCGDKERMAKDVDAMLHQLIEEHSDQDPKEAIKQLRKQKRYLRDVY